MANITACFSSDSSEWRTPDDLFQQLDAEFHFTLDPCSTDENAKCERHFTKQDDGLSQNWGGTQFSAILRMGATLPRGSKNVTANRGIRKRLSLC